MKGEQIDAQLLDEYLSASYQIMQEAIERDWQFSKRYQFCDIKPNDLDFQTCASGLSRGAIYIDGTFKYCHVQFGEEKASGKNIFEDISLVDMITDGEHLEDHISEDCKKCRYRSICTSGCPVYRTEENKDPQCSICHRFIPKYYELRAKE